MILVIVQARMASTRLPGKVMREVLRKPLISFMLERLKQCKNIHKVVVATSTDSSNDSLCEFLKTQGIDVYRGSEDDVLDRFYQAARSFLADTIIRVTADCPLIDPEVVDRAVESYRDGGFDYVATAWDTPGYPDGLDAEVFSFKALETAWKNARRGSEREHVTPYIRQQAGFKRSFIRPAKDHSDERWTVDQEEDFQVVKAVLEALYPKNPAFGMDDVLRYKAAHPEVFEANKKIGRNEGYQKSLKADAANVLVSIVVASYNGEKYLAEQLRSLCGQSYRHLEIIVVDDGSSDRSVAIAEEMGKKDPRILVFRNEKNLGLVANFIQGVSRAAGEYVCFCDQDDLWHPEKIEKLKKLLDGSQENMLAYSDLEICDEQMNRISGSFLKTSRIRARQGDLQERALLKNIAPGCVMMFRRPVRELMSRLWSDADFRRLNHSAVLDEIPIMHDHLAQVLSAGLGKIVFTPQTLVRYRQHAKNSIGAFYPARRGSEIFIRGLAVRLEALKPVAKDLPRIDWASMQRFLEAYRQPNRLPMAGKMDYFLWMRNSAFSDRMLGVLDCLTPGIYQGLKRMRS